MATTTQPRGTDWRLSEAVRPDSALLAELADITRASFAVGDMLPGLPAADGASDTAESIAADLAAGVRLWMAHTPDGRLAGCVRAIPRPDAVWQIRRLAVAVDGQGRGLGRALVRALERAALAEGMRRLVVWALVERGIAPLYSRLGYRTTGHFGSPDKLLSESIMDVSLAGPRSVLSYPWGTEPSCPRPGLLISWFGAARRTVAVAGRLTEHPQPGIERDRARARELVGAVRFLGGDGWIGAAHAEGAALVDTIASRADAVHGGALVFDRPCTEVVEFTMPRSVHPDLLALWRTPLGRR